MVFDTGGHFLSITHHAGGTGTTTTSYVRSGVGSGMHIFIVRPGTDPDCSRRVGRVVDFVVP